MKFVLFVTLIWSIMDSGWSITDEDLVRIEAGLAQIQVLTKEVQDLKSENQAGQKQIQVLMREVTGLKTEKQQLGSRVDHLEETCGVDFDGNLAQNETIEERVLILETQMTEVLEDMLEVQEDLVSVDEDIDFLFEEQVFQDDRILTLEQETEGLQATDVELDLRISDLEEGTTISFRAVMDETDDDNIPIGSTIIFSDVPLNEGNGYDAATGVFMVPPGGDGYYYFASRFTVNGIHNFVMDLRVNDVTVCTTYENNISDGIANVGCSAVVFLEEGDEVQNVYWSGSDTSPVYEQTDGVYNGFTGFRI